MRSFAATVAGAMILGCGPKVEQKQTVRPVLVQKVTSGKVGGDVIYSGEVRARYESDLAFRVAGKIVGRNVDVGAQVKRGTLLARLDPTDMQLNAQAASAQVTAAESEYAYTKAELERYTSLLEKKFIGQAQYDARLNAFKAAQAKLDQARAQRNWSGNQAAYTTLHADHDGVVTAVQAEVGQVVSAGQVVMKLARPQEKEVLINVPESRIAELKSALSILISLWADSSLRLTGKLRELAPGADATTRTYAARIRIVEQHPALQLGMTANVVLQSGDATAAIVVPLSSLLENGAGPTVWVVEDGKAVKRPVKVRQYREDGAVLESGLKAGELLVVAGAHKLLPDQPVRPLERDTAKAQGRTNDGGTAEKHS
jgi:RND family efflux transporter MFP subunit